MKLLFTSLLVLASSLNLCSQSVKFQFLVDGEQYLDIRKNPGGFNIIHQNNVQSSMFFGSFSGQHNINDPMIFGSGNNNTAYGTVSLAGNTTGARNTAIGSSAMLSNVTGSSNTALGYGALRNGISSNDNIGLGNFSLQSNLAGDFNIAIGTNSLNNTVFAERTIAIGSTAGTNDTSSVDNTYIGNNAGRGTVLATDGYDRKENVMIGSQSGYQNKTSGNVFLGYRSGFYSNADNQLYITNSDTDSLNSLIYGQFDNELLRINGDLNIDGLYTFPKVAPTSGQYLGYNGGSTLSWGNITNLWQAGAGDEIVYEDGDVGVGIGNPLYRLDVQDNPSTGYVARFRNSSAGSSSRGVIIQTGPNTNPSSSVYYLLFLDGNGTNIGGVRGNGGGGTMYSTTSDRRLKQNIKSFDGGLDLIKEMNPAVYQMKSLPNQNEIGFIAQELKEVMPQVVAGDPSDDVNESPMMVDYGRLTPVLVAAVKEQQVIIEDLKTRLDEQAREFAELKVLVESLQQGN